MQRVKEMRKKSLQFSTVYEIIEEMQGYVNELEKLLKFLRESEVTHPKHIEIKEENIKKLERELEETKCSVKTLKNLSWVKKK